MSLPERFWSKVDKNGPIPEHRPELGPCWVWTASVHHQWGYGHYRVGKKNVAAHRAAYESEVGPIPDGILACHHCDNPPCVNPAHLFLGTDADNVRDRDAKGRCRAGSRNVQKTHCGRGHEYTPENTRVYVSKKGWTMRFCVQCARAHTRASHSRHKAEYRAVKAENARKRRERDPELFRIKQRDYMRAHRARKREAAAHLAPPASF